jgi:hypothetical protein
MIPGLSEKSGNRKVVSRLDQVLKSKLRISPSLTAKVLSLAGISPDSLATPSLYSSSTSANLVKDVFASNFASLSAGSGGASFAPKGEPP